MHLIYIHTQTQRERERERERDLRKQTKYFPGTKNKMRNHKMANLLI